MAFGARETLPALRAGQDGAIALPAREPMGGYGKVFGDKDYVVFILAFLFTQICAAVMWVLLPVYAKTNFGLAESRYGLLPTTNALIVLALQIPVTALTRRRPAQWVMALGAFLYAIGVGSVALGTGFWGFWVSMVVMTFGELVLVPTSSTYAANLAPAHMRGRYMSLYGLSWNAAAGIGPVIGGALNDQVGPRSIWYGGALAGMISMLIFLVFIRPKPEHSQEC